MKAPTFLKHPVVRTPILAALRGLGFLADLKVFFRSIPHHTFDETNAIRALASIHPAIPRKIARLRARVIDRESTTEAGAPAGADLLFSDQEIQQCLKGLDENGVYSFKERLPRALVAALQDSLKSLPAYLRLEGGSEELLQHDSRNSGLFDIREHDLMRQHAIQEYATDPTWHAIAARYFRAPPVHDETVAWWTYPQSAEFASLNAQLFHSDRRRLSFLKFFTYLTDVTTSDGPHVVVPGSHRKRRFALRPDRRYSDTEVAAGGGNSPLEVLGAAGTVIAVDTQALHKGKMLEEGHRLVLETQFATDLLGPPSPVLHNDWSDVTKSRIKAHARVFQRFQ